MTILADVLCDKMFRDLSGRRTADIVIRLMNRPAYDICKIEVTIDNAKKACLAPYNVVRLLLFRDLLS